MSFWFSGDIPLFCVCFMARREENRSEWILQNYEAVREIYARSMLCLVLGFRADTAGIPFLMRQIERFEQQFPRDSFERAPLLALYELRAGFRTVCPPRRARLQLSPRAAKEKSAGPRDAISRTGTKLFYPRGSRQWQFGPTATGLVQAHRPLASQIWQRTKRS